MPATTGAFEEPLLLELLRLFELVPLPELLRLPELLEVFGLLGELAEDLLRELAALLFELFALLLELPALLRELLALLFDAFPPREDEPFGAGPVRALR